MLVISAALDWSATVADPDPQIRKGPGHPDPAISRGAVESKNFFRPLELGPQFGLKITGAGPPAPPLVPPLNYTPHQRKGYSFALGGGWRGGGRGEG